MYRSHVFMGIDIKVDVSLRSRTGMYINPCAQREIDSYDVLACSPVVTRWTRNSVDSDISRVGCPRDPGHRSNEVLWMIPMEVSSCDPTKSVRRS